MLKLSVHKTSNWLQEGKLTFDFCEIFMIFVHFYKKIQTLLLLADKIEDVFEAIEGLPELTGKMLCRKHLLKCRQELRRQE